MDVVVKISVILSCAAYDARSPINKKVTAAKNKTVTEKIEIFFIRSLTPHVIKIN
jgi:hypothetical protein